MKYTYAYKTSDGVRHEAALEAGSREEVFATLRAKGIRAIKVVAADGSKANGEIVRRGVRKRIVVVLLVLSAGLAGVTAYHAGREKTDDAAASQAAQREMASARHWLGPDVKVAFAHPSEEFLAHFAQPGVVVDEARLPTVDAAFAADFKAALAEPVEISPDEGARAMELKRIVIGLKQEASVRLQAGADLEALVRFLVQRQRMEAGLRRQLTEGVDAAPESERPRRLREARETIKTLGLEPL